MGADESRACQFVLERAGLDCISLLDEVSAANPLLEIGDGVLVDVGGGSTGVGIIRNGELTRVEDLPGGGHHLDLILAGALQIPLAEAESLKRDAAVTTSMSCNRAWSGWPTTSSASPPATATSRSIWWAAPS